MSTLTQLRQRTEAARRAFEEGRDRLFRPDGAHIYADTEHAERLGNLRAERNAVLREVEEATKELLSEANGDLTSLQNISPLSLLDKEELARAASGYPLAVADISNLNREELAERLSAVSRGASKGDRLAYLLAVRASRRVDEGDIEAGAILDQLSAGLNTDAHKAEVEATQRCIEEASEIKDLVWLTRNEQSASYAPQYNVPVG